MVDADLRKPAQFKLLSQVYKKNEKQIGDVFTGKAQAAEAIRRLQNGNIFLMGGNRSYRNATKLLASEAAKETFSRLRGIVDYVIVDTPPVYLAADTEELMPIADAALLVVRQNGAKVRDINDVIDIFKKTDCKLLGCVLNDVENSFLGNAGIYGDGYSNKYGYGHSYYKKRQESKEKA